MVRAARHVGTAGWSITAVQSSDYPSEGSHLERYASRLNAVEINSSFSRSHRRATYAEWAGTVGPTFLFSVKVPKAITHDNGLVGTDELLKNFAEEISGWVTSWTSYSRRSLLSTRVTVPFLSTLTNYHSDTDGSELLETASRRSNCISSSPCRAWSRRGVDKPGYRRLPAPTSLLTFTKKRSTRSL